MPSDLFERLDELAAVVPPESWMLVGGLMVHCHAQRAGLVHARPTDDADLVIELRVASYAQVAAQLEAIGYRRHLSIDGHGPFHRFTRGDEHIDLMVDDETTARFAGRPVLTVPGARSALRRTIDYGHPGHGTIRLPDIGSALSLKGAAYRLPGANRVRHLQDGVTLFACAGVTGTALDLSNSMRAHVNALIAGLDQMEAWGVAPMTDRRRAVVAIQQVRPDWRPQPFVLPQRHRA